MSLQRPFRLAALIEGDSGPRSRLALGAVWLALVLWLYPGFFSTLGVGLDPSWAWAINTLPHTGSLPGRDVVFTYGPLGWLLMPAVIGSNARWALLFRALVHAVFAAGLARALRGVSPGRALAVAGLFLAAFQLGLSMESRLILTLALLLAPEVREPRRIPWAPALAGGLTVLYGLMKMTLGVNAGVLLAVFCLLAILRGGPGRFRAVLAAAAGALAALLAAVPLVFGSPGNALRWLTLEMEIVHGYAAAMRVPAEPMDLFAGLLALAIFAGLCLWAWRARGGGADLWALLLLPAGFAFQHGFIRADAHMAIFFPFLLAAVALGLLFVRGDGELRAAGGVYLALLLLALPFALSYAQNPAGIDLTFGLKGLENLRWATRPESFERGLTRIYRQHLRPMRLPPELADPIRRDALRVDVLPWELSYLAANDLRWAPSPTLQLYATYTAKLDALTAEHFAGPGSPDLLFVDYSGIDHRDMLWDTPATWRSILARYEIDPGRPAAAFVVAKRRERPLSWRLEPAGVARAREGEWIEVPPAVPGERLFAGIDLEPSWTGRLERRLLGVPPVFLQAVDDLGRRRLVRILPETAGGGLMMSPAPRNLGELSAFWKGEPVEKIVRFRLEGPGLRCFQDEIRIRWVAGRMK